MRSSVGTVEIRLALRADGVFEAREVLAKHDERYMPKEVTDALKKSGEWRPDAPATQAMN